MISRKQIIVLTLILVSNCIAASTNIIFVTSTNDSGVGSLRQALQQASGLGGATISLSVTGTITLLSSLPPLNNINLLGQGVNVLQISGKNICRPFEIPAGSTSSLSQLTICCGVNSNGNGGAIFNSGDLTITGCSLTNNRASVSPGNGGAIYNVGTLKMIESSVTDNSSSVVTNTSVAGGAIYNLGTVVLRGCSFLRNRAVGASGLNYFSFNGASAAGGAIYSQGGALHASDCKFEDNSALGGNGFQGSTPAAGGSAAGGAVYALGGALHASDCRLENNFARGGYGSGGSTPGVDGSANGGALSLNNGLLAVTNTLFLANFIWTRGSYFPGTGGGAVYSWGSSFFVACRVTGNAVTSGSASGGGCALYGQSVLIRGCSITMNSARGADGRNGLNETSAETGGRAIGGGIFISATNSLITDSTVDQNATYGGKGGDISQFPFQASGSPGRGGSSQGGGIACDGNFLTMVNTTLSGNSSFGGNAGLATMILDRGQRSYSSATPGLAEGGGLWYWGGAGNLNSLTAIANSALGGADAWTGPPGTGRGGGVWSTSSSATLRNCLLQGNSASTDGPDSFGIMSQGYNLFSNSAGVSNLLASDIQNSNAQVGPLQDNGGLTSTHALLANSPAIDRGDAGTNRADQRGFVRGIDFPEIPNAFNGDDIGAVESDPVLKFMGIELSGNDIYVRFSTRSDATYVLQYKTELSGAWISTSPISGTGGVVRKFAGSRSVVQRFLRVAQQ